MSLPDFLGIGVPKAGTTWLYETLISHPSVWLPPNEREIHYFNEHYERRGLSWYRKFFPSTDPGAYDAIGEITPLYLYLKPQRIASIKSDVPSVGRFIILLRNPVDRLYSHYWFRRRIDNIDVSLREFIDARPHAVEWGHYAKYFKRWLQYYDREQFLILTTEGDLNFIESTRNTIATFLEIDSEQFPPEAGKSKENTRHVPYFRQGYMWAVKINRILKRHNIYWPSSLVESIGFKNWFGRRKIEKELDSELREELLNLFMEDITELKEITGRDFAEWGI